MGKNEHSGRSACGVRTQFCTSNQSICASRARGDKNPRDDQSERIAVVADRGYFKIEDIEACEKAGIEPYVPRP